MIEKLSTLFFKNGVKHTDDRVDLEQFQKAIKYQFKSKDLLIQAVSHRSYYIDVKKQIFSNERLEFLGDAVLDLIVTEYLFQKFSEQNEGLLSQKKAVLVSRKVLGKISNEQGLGEFLILNKGEEKTGGRSRLSNLANLFEAILGAIYLDGGIEPSLKFVNTFLLSRSKELLKTKTYFNYKSILLEFAQSKGWGAPEYEIIDESGPDHQKLFLVKVNINDSWDGEGRGPSKKAAEQNAAKCALGAKTDEFPELQKLIKS